MAETIFDQDGEPVEVFVRISGGIVDAIVRAASEAAWAQGAVFYGLLVETDGALTPAPGVEIDVLGPVMTDPGERDDEGVYTREPEFDDRHHLNLRIHGPALEKVVEGTSFPKWKQMAINWTVLGDVDLTTNAEEQAVVLHQVALIDPDSIRSPSRVWL